jgi:hypothetical protein
MKVAALFLLNLSIGLAQPRFDADRVLPSNTSKQIALEPGMLMSVYGEELGPAAACIGYGDQHHLEKPNPLLPDQVFVSTVIYPKELCGVQVFVGPNPAGLLYVSAKQINFKVPQEAGITGTADVRVIYLGKASLSAVLKLGVQATRVYLDGPGYVGMPVWLHIEHPLGRPRTINYPYGEGAAGFGCNEVEVRRNGVPLEKQPGSDWMKIGGVISGFPCGSYALGQDHHDRLPLHLLYRFDTPGTYEVRFYTHQLPKTTEITHSDWTPIEILPARPDLRAALLADARNHPPSDPGEILSDLLPNILGYPDDESFEILARYLEDPSRAVRAYAQKALSYWPTAEKRAAGTLRP